MENSVQTKKKQLEIFSEQKFQQYALDDWRIVFGIKYSYPSCAHCSSSKKVIFIEEWTVNEFKIETLKDIFLHELAHAILGDVNYVKGFPVHGKLFRDTCRKIGCKGFRAANNEYIFDIYGRFKVSREEENAVSKLRAANAYLKVLTDFNNMFNEITGK